MKHDFYSLEKYVADEIYNFPQRFGEMDEEDIRDCVNKWFQDFEISRAVRINVE
jgi:hypothetical protein